MYLVVVCLFLTNSSFDDEEYTSGCGSKNSLMFVPLDLMFASSFHLLVLAFLVLLVFPCKFQHPFLNHVLLLH